MLFKKRGKIREKENEQILSYLDKYKKSAKHKETILKKSVSFHEDLVYRMKLEKMKYYFFLKEARYRKIGIKK